MTFTRYCGGKKPARRRMGVPALGDFLDKATSWPSVPAQGWEFKVPSSDLNILGNDQWGDCGEAGCYHLLQAQTANTGKSFVPTTQQTLDLYTAVTGFNQDAGPSGSNPTDQGTDLQDLLNYAKNTGVPTVGDQINKIVGWASLDISSVAQMRYAAYTFGGAYLGINCPQQCEDDTNNWNFGPGLPIAGGHCIVMAGEGSAGAKIGSWGLWIPSSWSFLLSYLDEGYIICSSTWIDAQSKSPSGLDLDGLIAAMKAI